MKQVWETLQRPAFLWGGTELEHALSVPAFKRSAQRTVVCPTSSAVLTGQASSICLEAAKNKRAGQLAAPKDL